MPISCSAFGLLSPFSHSAIHALSAFILHHLLRVVFVGYNLDDISAGLLLRPSSLYPVAFLAALSAISFPGVPMRAGIHRATTGFPRSWSLWTCSAISSSM